MNRSKKLTAVFLLLVFFFTTTGFSSVSNLQNDLTTKKITKTSGSTGVVYNTGGIGLNFRTSPWGKIQGGFIEGTKLKVLGKSGAWVKVKSGNKTGYVHGKYLKVSNSSSGNSSNTGTSVTGTKYVSVGSSYLNVRTGPWGTKIGKLYSGDKVQIIGKSGDWVKIKHNGRTAFVHGDYLSKNKPSSGTTTPPAGNVTGSAAARAIVKEAHNQLGTTRYRTKILDYGNLACAAFVSGVLKNSGTITGNGSINTVGLRNIVVQQGWKKVSLSNIQPGDVIFWGPYPGGIHGHVGVIDSKQGGTWYSIDNSSSQRTPVRHTLNTTRPIVGVYRAPGA